MFYSQIILAKKGPLGKIWLAAHWDKKLTKVQIFQTDIARSVDSIVKPQVPLALRVSGHLLLGVVRIYSRKVKYLMNDCTEALVKIKLAFRPGAVDLPEELAEGAKTGGITLANFNDLDVELDMALPFALDELPAPDQWMATGSQTMARKQDITLADSELGGELLGRAGSMLKRHRSALSLSSAESHLHGHGDEDEDGEEWAQTEFDPRDDAAHFDYEEFNESGVIQPDGMLSDSDIELARDADRSAASSLRGAGQLSVSGVGVKPMDRSDTTSLFGPQSAEDGAIGLRETELEEDYGDDLEQIPALDNIDAEEVRAAAAAAAAAANSAGKAEGFSESYSDDLPTGKFGGSGLNLSAMVLADHQRKKISRRKRNDAC
jgi:hypothetical protein